MGGSGGHGAPGGPTVQPGVRMQGVEPMEINAGQYYLRALRHDERVDDLPAICEHDPAADAGYVERRTVGWAGEDLFSWAVCAQTDVDLLAQVDCVVGDGVARVTGWARPGRDGAEQALREGSAAVRGFAEGYLGLTVAD